MSSSATATALNGSAKEVRTTLNYYLDPELGGHINITPGTPSFYRRKYATHPVTIHDMKGSEGQFNLSKQGFQIHPHESAGKEFKEEDQIKDFYYPETEARLKQM